jgi:hypothetical protein
LTLISELFELATLKGTKFEFKYPAWGFYPPRELQELLTMFRISVIKKAIIEYGQEAIKADIATALNISEAEKLKAKKLSEGMANFFKGPLA